MAADHPPTRLQILQEQRALLQRQESEIRQMHEMQRTNIDLILGEIPSSNASVAIKNEPQDDLQRLGHLDTNPQLRIDQEGPTAEHKIDLLRRPSHLLEYGQARVVRASSVNPQEHNDEGSLTFSTPAHDPLRKSHEEPHLNTRPVTNEKKRSYDDALLFEDQRLNVTQGSQPQSHKKHQYVPVDRFPNVSPLRCYTHIVRNDNMVLELHCHFCHATGGERGPFGGVVGLQTHISRSHDRKADAAWVIRNCIKKTLSCSEISAVMEAKYLPEHIGAARKRDLARSCERDGGKRLEYKDIFTEFEPQDDD